MKFLRKSEGVSVNERVRADLSMKESLQFVALLNLLVQCVEYMNCCLKKKCFCAIFLFCLIFLSDLCAYEILLFPFSLTFTLLLVAVCIQACALCIVAVPGGSCNTPYFETFSKGVLVKTTDFKHKEGVL
jgi:hypothetical protein